MSALAIYLVIWLLLGLAVGAGASLTGGTPPYGLGVDLAAAVVTVVAVGLLDYAILPLLGYEGPIRLAAMVAEPLVAAVVVMWLLRVIKRRRERSGT